MTEVLIEAKDGCVPIQIVDEAAAQAFLQAAPALVRGLAGQSSFTGKAGQVLVVPGDDGAPARVLVGGSSGSAMALRALPARLPAGDYRFEALPSDIDPAQATLAWALGAYRHGPRLRSGP